MSWWSDKYNRPLKDPILLSYTLEELAYEYYSTIERRKYDVERAQEESDKIEEAKLQADDEWADQMEAAEEAAAAKKPAAVVVDPMKDPKNIEWMKQEIERNKIELGEDFGEDLSVNFEDK